MVTALCLFENKESWFTTNGNPESDQLQGALGIFIIALGYVVRRKFDFPENRNLDGAVNMTGWGIKAGACCSSSSRPSKACFSTPNRLQVSRPHHPRRSVNPGGKLDHGNGRIIWS